MFRIGRARALAFVAFCYAASPPGRAGPNVPLDDPRYDRIALLRAQGVLPATAENGGFFPLSEEYVAFLLATAEGRDPSRGPHGFWVSPLDAVTLRTAFAREDGRTYSVPARSRLLAGNVALSCERQEGRPCGDGGGMGLELDSSMGIDEEVTAAVRLRLQGGLLDSSPALTLDRAYLHAQFGIVSMEFGRDVLRLGPGTRTQLQWGANAPPIDHVRLSTLRPLNLLGDDGRVLRLSALYFVGRLREPQRFHATLVTGARLQLDLFDALELGGTRLLQLGGRGAPHVSVGDFILEHFTRTGDPNTDGISNNRLSFDLSLRLRALRGTRLYYEMAFEDLRKEFLDTLRYDTDYLVGAEARALDGAGHVGVLLEAHKTGRVSQEHTLFTTGMTNQSRTVGSPLGPDARSLFLGLRFDWEPISLRPWAEMVRLSSATYESFDPGPGGIKKVTEGIDERRNRAGLDVHLALTDTLELVGQGFAERVNTLAFVPGDDRWNGGGSLALSWRPGLRAFR